MGPKLFYDIFGLLEWGVLNDGKNAEEKFHKRWIIDMFKH